MNSLSMKKITFLFVVFGITSLLAQDFQAGYTRMYVNHSHYNASSGYFLSYARLLPNNHSIGISFERLFGEVIENKRYETRDLYLGDLLIHRYLRRYERFSVMFFYKYYLGGGEKNKFFIVPGFGINLSGIRSNYRIYNTVTKSYKEKSRHFLSLTSPLTLSGYEFQLRIEYQRKWNEHCSFFASLNTGFLFLPDYEIISSGCLLTHEANLSPRVWIGFTTGFQINFKNL